MRLAKVQRQSVQSLGRQNVNLTGVDDSAAAGLQAAASALGGLAESAAKISQIQSEREGQQYSLMVVKAEQAVDEFIGGREQIPVNEVPSDLRTPEMEMKQTVPTASIYPQLYEQGVGSVIEQGSYIVSNEAARQKQKTAMKEGFTRKMIDVSNRSAKALRHQVNNDIKADAQDALDSGDLQLAKDLYGSLDESPEAIAGYIKEATQESWKTK